LKAKDKNFSEDFRQPVTLKSFQSAWDKLKKAPDFQSGEVYNNSMFLTSGKIITLKVHLAYIWSNLSFFLPAWIITLVICGVLIVFIIRQKKKKLIHIVSVNFLVFVAFLATIIFAGELYFRFIYDNSDTLGDLKTNQRWLARHVVTNLDHFRDRDFSTQKLPDVTRIGVIGDSFAYGWGIDADQRFSNILEKKLNQDGPGKYEVYNASVPGWESKDELEFLKTRAGMFHFDTIILSYFLNDIYKNRAFNLDYMTIKYDYWKKYPIIRAVVDRSYFLEFVYVRLFNLFQSAAYDIGQREMTIYRDPQSWKNHEQTLDEIINWCQENNANLIVVIFPYLDLVNKKPYPAAFVHEKLNKFFTERNVPVIDLYPQLAPYPPKKLQANPFDMHPSAFVHGIVADLLSKQILGR
jgi:hypothetical protein